jgi:hypothetical protein
MIIGKNTPGYMHITMNSNVKTKIFELKSSVINRLKIMTLTLNLILTFINREEKSKESSAKIKFEQKKTILNPMKKMQGFVKFR